MSYNTLLFYAEFLPVVLIVYQLVPKKYRWLVLLGANYYFFWVWSHWMLLYQVAMALITYVFARILGSMKKAPEGMDRKAFRRKKKAVLTAAVLLNLAFLIVLKYTNFICSSFAGLFGFSYTMLVIAFPIGISYYTLQNISYLVDVSNRKIEAEKNPLKLALYSSFFLTILEGPITRYGDMKAELLAGEPVTASSFASGAERMMWGLFQKMVIADHLSIAVTKIFQVYSDNGVICLLGAIICTIQLYMDFAGTIDIALGAARIFNIKITENFRQPFFAKNASDFWRRWHITLGAFLRDYVFYPVSLSAPIQAMTRRLNQKHHKKLARYAGPTIALMLVWLCNGLWHGGSWTYLAYGAYYFILMFIEMLAEKPFEDWCRLHNWNINGRGVKTFRFIKLFFIVCMGEMLSRADGVHAAASMLKNIFTNFNLSESITVFPLLGMTSRNWIMVSLAFCVVIVVSVLKEKKYPIREKFEGLPFYGRWAVLYGLLFAIIMFGAYGPGYDAVAMIYAVF